MKKIAYVSLLCLVLIGGTACSSKQDEVPEAKKTKIIEVSKESSTIESSSHSDYPYTFEDIAEKPEDPNQIKVVKAFIDSELPMFIESGFGPNIQQGSAVDNGIVGSGNSAISFYLNEDATSAGGIITITFYANQDNYTKAIELDEHPENFDVPATISTNDFNIEKNDNLKAIMVSSFGVSKDMWDEYVSTFNTIK